jgi:hypothetical protein
LEDAAGELLDAADPDAAADAEVDATGVVDAVTMGVGDGVGFKVTSTVTTGVGCGGVGLHAVSNDANNNTATTAKTIFLFIEFFRLLLNLIFSSHQSSMMAISARQLS